MKDKMTRWFRYTAEDVKAAQAELDELADRGWELAELGIFTAAFRRAEHPRRCWVEPARWTSLRRKDERARSDYLALCDEAGWVTEQYRKELGTANQEEVPGYEDVWLARYGISGGNYPDGAAGDMWLIRRGNTVLRVETDMGPLDENWLDGILARLEEET